MKKIFYLTLGSFLFLFVTSLSVFASSKVREGKHHLTLQWIESKQPGTAILKKQPDDTYTIKGEHKDSKGNYLTIDGKLEVISARELHFEGEVLTKVDHIYGGNVCKRAGKQVFKAYGKRKYWRMHDKINCDGVVRDYVDIFF